MGSTARRKRTFSKPASSNAIVSSGSYLPGQQTPANDPSFPNGAMHPYPLQNPQPVVMYPQQMQPSQIGYMYPQQMYSNQMAGYGYGYNYGQSQQQNAYFAQQTISALSVRDDGGLRNSSMSSLPTGRPARPEDKLFGDLVDMSHFKQGKGS